MMADKPPYAVPPMAAILATPENGLTHVSTFSGGGGTCLGFRLAGFRTLLASDINPHAVETYRANLPSPILQANIRQLTGAQLLAAVGLEVGELDVLEGSPPCTAFSTAGTLAKDWNKRKVHAGAEQANVEDLFFDWLRLVDEIRPRCFVAENVKGLVRGVAKGYFKTILHRMKALGYRTEARVLDAQWLGVPQRRPRVIFVGLREDLHLAPAFPTPWSYQYSVRDVLPELLSLPSIRKDFQTKRVSSRRVSPTITSTQGFDGGHEATVQVMHDTSGKYSEGDITRKVAPTVTSSGSGQFKIQHRGFFSKYRDITSQAAPTVLADTRAHFFLTTATTTERKITIDELKRLCSFPDDYVVAGSYSQQWQRLGNAVPPLMAYAIAAALREVLLSHGPRS
jgi:DNA (cytosine-5)-methyltransferase 1